MKEDNYFPTHEVVDDLGKIVFYGSHKDCMDFIEYGYNCYVREIEY